MVDGWLFVLTLVGALGCGLAAGALFAFSSFVMRALRNVSTPVGLAAMQSINIEAPTRWFMLGFAGPAVVCVVAIVVAVFQWSESYAPYLLAAGAVYLIGVIGITGGYHQPRNLALLEFDPSSSEGERAWTEYAGPWTRWNHVRVLAGLVASGLFVAALYVACG
jgi:uncharacterized membrane protein